ncbi:MAG TPA: ABC transporter permease, partial [Vicinamibacterales bacterium]|nr:ABC transporter permease [Vicinamibacterales bacterium]
MADDRPPIPPPDEVERELEFHVEMQTRRFVAAGVPADEARRRALARMGNVDRVRDECREIDREQEHDMQRSAWWPGVMQDVRYAWRGLRRAKLFTAAAVATLAIGIGAATAMFSVVYAVLLRGLPYDNADRLAVIWNSYADSLEEASIAPAEFADIQDLPEGFDGVAAMQPLPTSLTGDCAAGAGCQPERVAAYRVSPNFFTLLGVQPTLGRAFVAADGVAGADLVVVLTDTLWRSRYGGDPDVVGRTVTVGGRPATIVGVMPSGVRFPDEPVGFLKERADLWIAYRWEQARTEGRGNQYLGMIGRVRPDQSIDTANRILDRVEQNFKQAFPKRYAPEEIRWSMIAKPLRDQIIGDVRP